MKQLYLLLIFLPVLWGCSKIPGSGDKMPENVYLYNQTQCSDKWGYGQADGEMAKKLKTYLESKQITVISITITSPPGDMVVCQACSCSTGRVFKVVVAESDLDKLKAEGFHQ